MVANFTKRAYGVNQVFWFVKFGYIERVVKSDFFSEKTYFTSFVRNMFWATILYKYHGLIRGVKYVLNICHEAFSFWRLSVANFVCIWVSYLHLEYRFPRFKGVLLVLKYCMSKKSWTILYSYLLYKLGQDFLDVKYVNNL